MQVNDLIEQVEMQDKVTYCVFNSSGQVTFTYEQAKDRDIRYMWAEGDELFIEVYSVKLKKNKG